MSAIVKRIDSVFVPVTDLKRSEEWYLRMFPFRVTFRSGDGTYVGFRFADSEPGNLKTALTLYKKDRVIPQEHIAFNFFSEDIDDAHRFLKEQGVEVQDIQGGEGMRFFEFTDPDGNRLEAVTFPGG